MREYVEIMRAILRGEDPPPGEKFRTGFHFMGYEPLRPDLPIYLAGLSPGMLRLADIRDVVVPTVREGREKAGKDPEGFDIVAAVPSAVTDEFIRLLAAVGPGSRAPTSTRRSKR